MCLAQPMKICSIEGIIARCETYGVFREVNMLLIADQHAKPGDYVLVHTGYAIQKLSKQHVRESLDAYDAMSASHFNNN